MNITPINAVSFKGEWRTKDVYKAPRSFEIGKEFKRLHIYHPDANESEIDIAMKMFEKDNEFSGANKVVRKPVNSGLANCINTCTHVVKLGKRLLSKEDVQIFTIAQKVLRAKYNEIGERLAQISETLKLQPKPVKSKAPRKRPVRFI